MSSNIDVINTAFAAFGRGDVDQITAQCTNDVKWICRLDPAVPWAGDFSGSNVPQFFQAIYSNVDVNGFEPQEYVSEGDTVIVTGTFDATPKTTGIRFNAKWIFVFKFKGGKVSSYEQFATPDMAAAFSGRTLASANGR